MGTKACEERRYRETNPAALKLLQASSFVANLPRVFLSSRTPTPRKQTKLEVQMSKHRIQPTKKKREAQEVLGLSLLSRPTQKKTQQQEQGSKRVHFGARVHFASAH
jgi:hypothetical protein